MKVGRRFESSRASLLEITTKSEDLSSRIATQRLKTDAEKIQKFFSLVIEESLQQGLKRKKTYKRRPIF